MSNLNAAKITVLAMDKLKQLSSTTKETAADAEEAEEEDDEGGGGIGRP